MRKQERRVANSQMNNAQTPQIIVQRMANKQCLGRNQLQKLGAHLLISFSTKKKHKQNKQKNTSTKEGAPRNDSSVRPEYLVL